MGLLIVTPSLLLGGHVAGPGELALLLSIIFAVAVFLEYRTSYPSFVEFRDAPPINRIRFVSLLLIVFFLSIIAKHLYSPTNLTGMVSGIGSMIGTALDFPYSPVRMVLLMLPDGVSSTTVHTVRASAGLSYLIAVATVVVFYLIVRISGWPTANGAFNVWVNLPLFDPTVGGDVVHRLHRDARVNMIIGVLLPFLIPAAIVMASRFVPPMNMANPHVLIWTVSGWAFLPASMIIRGIALFRVSDLIEEKRRRTYANAEHMQTA
ncbi:MAG: hypothetical protein AB3N23_04845 [Paracoccaceae bacterium]